MGCGGSRNVSRKVVNARKILKEQNLTPYPKPMNQTVLKSENDKNEYKALTLDNGLRVLLIQSHVDTNIALKLNLLNKIDEDGEGHRSSEAESEDDEHEMVSDNDQAVGSEEEMALDEKSSKKQDPTKTLMAAAALCVSVGSFSDPSNLPGLAHFLEHMIFMGSEKYPEENYYDAFISEHGGSDNAWTDCERTLYTMEVTPKFFKESLDIFAQCFISPLLKQDSMDREIEAVDSEFELSVSSDNERIHLLLSGIAKDPVSHFTCGNKITLKEEPSKNGIDVYAALRDFQKQHYSAHHMTLAVQSTEKLETLENWVKEIFSPLPNNGLPPPSFENVTEPFKTEAFCKLYKIIPVKNIHKLVVTWALPPVTKHYRSKPIDYLMSLTGHEGHGSILALLKKKSWGLVLEAGNEGPGFQMNSISSVFYIEVLLTDDGMDHVCEVLTVIFQYLEMLRKKGPQETIFKEFQLMYDNSFRFHEQSDPIQNVEAIAEHMQLYPVEHYLSGHCVYFEYDPKVITEFLECMKPELANIMILSSRYTDDECTEFEKWTNCKYSCCDIPQAWLDQWKDLPEEPELHLPEPNRFIATNFDLKHNGESENKYPIQILEDEISQVWFKEDVKFKTPRACTYFYICTPEMYKTAETSALFDLFHTLLMIILAKDAYPASMADLSYSFDRSSEGFIIKIRGFDHKLPLLLDLILDHIINFDPEEDIFEGMKTQLTKSYHNSILKPSNLAGEVRKEILRKIYWTSLDKRLALQSLTRTMLKEFVPECFKAFTLKCFCHGNVTKQEALAMNQMVKEKLHPQPIPRSLNIQTTQLPVGTSVCRIASFSKEDKNSVISNYYQLGQFDLKSACKFVLFTEFMHEPCFDILRTREQLGYDVSCSKVESWGTFGFKVAVQTPSDKFSSSHVDDRIEEFLKNFLDEMQIIDEEKFNTQRDSLISVKQCDDLALRDESDRYWGEIYYHRYVFNRREQEIEFLKSFQLEEFKTWLKQELSDFTSEKKKLSVQIVGPCEVSKKACNDTELAAEQDMMTDTESTAQPTSSNTLTYLTGPSENEHIRSISNIGRFKENLQFYEPCKVAA